MAEAAGCGAGGSAVWGAGWLLSATPASQHIPGRRIPALGASPPAARPGAGCGAEERGGPGPGGSTCAGAGSVRRGVRRHAHPRSPARPGCAPDPWAAPRVAPALVRLAPVHRVPQGKQKAHFRRDRDSQAAYLPADTSSRAARILCASPSEAGDTAVPLGRGDSSSLHSHAF